MVAQEFKLNGKTALVAGDSRFWSKYVAAALAEAGADVAVAAKNSKKAEDAASEARRLGRKAIAIPVDVTKSSQVERMVGQAISQFGKIDILVNTTDLEFAQPFTQITGKEWHQVMEANLTSVFLCCQAVGRHMLEQKRGRIITVNSCLAERGQVNSTAYCAAKGGVRQLTKALALEWARQGITVNAIGAGWFSETDTAGAPEEGPVARYIPLRRYGHPREIGSLVVYLASDASSFTTGQLWYVDGAVMDHP